MICQRLVRWLAPLLVACVCFLPSAHGQTPRRANSDEGSRTAALPWAVAFMSLLAIMVIVCKPSRKMEHKR